MTQAATYEQILFEQQGRVGVITLNRPERLNAWTWKMNAEIADAITRCNDDAGVGAVVITGAGRGFCSGADMGTFDRAIERRETATSDEERRAASAPPPALQREAPEIGFYQQSKPIICAINGPAIGVGLTMTLTMDLRIASDQARFSMRFVRMGIVPEASSTLYLPQIVGLSNALELSLTGRIIDAQEALRYGLVSRVVPHDQLLPETMALALEGRYEDYTIGKDISVAQACEIGDIAARHGFRLSGFRSFEQPVTPEQIARVRERAHARTGSAAL